MFTLDAYAARSCPLKVHHAFHPGLTRPAPTGTVNRIPGAAEFLSSAYAAILAGAPGTVDLRGLADEPSEAQEAACLAAMADGAPVIVGGLLPRDWEGHRAGRPDLLVRDAAGGYLPGLVKYQRMVDPRRDDLPFAYADLSDLTRRRTTTGWRYRWHWRWGNALQLAHLWRLLAAHGLEAAGGPAGLAVGSDDFGGDGPRASLIDLEEAAAPPAAGQLGGPVEGAEVPAPVSALDRYDHEFALRVELAEAARAAAPEDPPLLVPIVSYECAHCLWWPVCRPLLDDDDLSLRINKSPLDAREITVLREAGVGTVAQLAASDLDALLPDYLPQVAHRLGAEDRLRLAQRRSLLLRDGVELERTTRGPIDLPVAELEIDVDVETSRDDRVYLWGFWVSRDGGEGSYHEFSSFTELDDAGELELARRAMAWLRELVGAADARVYHYSDYEVVRLARLTRPGDEVMEWAIGFARDHFFDLFSTVRQHFFGTNGLGLKVVASAGAGFHWRDEDPGGLNSMRWFEEAVRHPSAEVREQARTRVLEYNEDDVRATRELRRWLRGLDT